MKQKLLTLLTLLLTICSGAWADDISDYATGFEENATTNYDKGECGSIVVSTDAPRTGGYCLSTVYTGGTGNKRWYPKATFAVPQNSYFHIIGYAKLLSSDVTGESSSTQAYADAYVGTAKAGDAVNLTTSWKRVYSTSGKASSNKTGAQARFYRKHASKLAVLFDDVIAYVSTNSAIDLTAPTSATSASATASAISWTVGTDANTGVQKTLIFKRTSGSADDLTLNDQGIYSLTPTEGPSIDQSSHWTLVAVVNGDATSYEAALDGSTRYAIVHRDLAYNYSTPTYVTTPSAVTYEVTYKANNETEEADVVENVATVGDCPNTFSAPSGKIFAGWNTQADGNGTGYAVGAAVTSALTLFAQWEEIVYYTVTLNPNGGEIVDATGWTLDNGQYKKENIVNGTELALPTFTKTDNTFMTWRDGSGNEYNSPVTVNSDLTITAIWGKEIEKIIYSWESPEGTAIETGGTATHYNGSSPVDGNTRVNYANTANSTTYYTICLNGKTDYSTDHIRFVLDEVIKTGDEVRVTAYCNKNESANASAKMDTQSDTEIFADDVNLPNIYSSGSPVLRTYIIPEGINTNEIKMTRNQTGTTTFITKLQIVRTEVVETVPVTISAAGYATFSSTSKLDLTDVEGLTAYKATSTSESSVTLVDVTGVVPAETGLLLKGAADTYYIPMSTETATADVDGNLLQSTATAEYTVTGSESGTAYVFGKLVDEVGFFKAAAGKKIGVGKSWLLVPGTGAKDVEFLSFVFGDEEQGETDGIKSVQGSRFTVNGEAYNLAGQRVGADYKGIVIVNGKKYLRK